MKAIVAVDKFWGIGKNNDLLFHLKEDMAFFRKTTLNKVVVMGSNTLKSFPEGKPLKNRVNIVLYPGGLKRDDCIIVNDFEELKNAVHKYPKDEVFIIGGAMFYKSMLPYCSEVYVTKVEADGEATVFYENLDNLSEWTCVEIGEPILDGKYTIRFCVYKNRDIKIF